MSLSNSVQTYERLEGGELRWYMRHTYLQEDFLAEMPPLGPYESREEAEIAAARTQEIIEIELFYPTHEE